MPDLVRFGPFELDLETAELLAAGRTFACQSNNSRFSKCFSFGKVGWSPGRRSARNSGQMRP